jgi:hypothetical protein
VGGLAINLRGVGQQNRKSVGRNGGGRLFDIIDSIVMRIVDIGQIDATPLEREFTCSGRPAAAEIFEGITYGKMTATSRRLP